MRSEERAPRADGTPARATCGAPTRAGGSCRARPLADGRCRRHGGGAGRGDDVAAVTGEQHRTRLAERLAERAAEGEGEATRWSLRDELALVDAHTSLLLEELAEEPSPHNDAVWRQILKNIDLRRRLVATELTQIVFHQRHLSAKEAMALVTKLVEAVKRHVHDDATLSAIARELRAITDGERLNR